MNASSPEMETICPLSSSPCSGVLKFRLASNASASMVFASAISFVWVMGVLRSFFLIASRSGDRLGCVSYSKEETRGTRANAGGERFLPARYDQARKVQTGEKSIRLKAVARRFEVSNLSHFRDRKNIFATHLPAIEHEPMLMVPQHRMPHAAVNGAAGRRERQWSSTHGNADAPSGCQRIA